MLCFLETPVFRLAFLLYYRRTQKLTMLLTLTSAARALEIGVLSIMDLDKHSCGYIFHFGKKTPKISRKLNLRILSNFILSKKTTICVCQHVDLYI